MDNENPYQPPNTSTEKQVEENPRLRNTGIRQSFLMAMLFWIMLLALGYSDTMRQQGPYAELPLMILFYLGGPAIGILQWIYLLPWAFSRPVDRRPYRDGLLIGGAIAAGVCLLVPGAACLVMMARQ